jgi:hypothetical protein
VTLLAVNQLLAINQLIFATNTATPPRARARCWLGDIVSGTETLALSWHRLIGSVQTTTRVLRT